MVRLQGSASTRLFGHEGLRIARLMAYLLMAVALMVMDYRHQYVPRVRGLMEAAFEPVFHLAAFPSRAIDATRTYTRSFSELRAENEMLNTFVLEQAGSMQRMAALEEENGRLRALLDATAGRAWEFRFAEMVQVNFDPFSHQVMIDRGNSDGVFAGQAVIDGSGVMGQVEEVHLHMSRVRLVSDPDHALPVQINRTGLRTIAYGTGSTAELLLPNVPFQADVRAGDLLVTSGLGDRFPAGFPVAEVVSVNRETGGNFAEVRARPLASLDRGKEVLLVISVSGAEDDAPAAEEGS